MITLDFAKHMQRILQQEEVKPTLGGMVPQPEQPDLTPNRKQLIRFSHRISDRMWIGPKRF